MISCAGVPEKVIKRAASVLEAIAQNKQVERLCDESISAQDQLYMVLIQKPDLRYDPYAQVIYTSVHV